MVEIFLCILIGICLGFVAGLVPGLHPNFIGILIVSGFLNENTLFILIPMLVSASFFEIIRSVFLFVPDESHVLAMHPIFKFVNKGQGLAAIKLVLFGTISAILISIIASPLLTVFVPPVFVFIKDYVPFFLLFIAVFLIIRDENSFFALLVFSLSGLIGFYGLDLLEQPLLILLTGFFGFPVLFKVNRKIKKQIEDFNCKIPRGSAVRGLGSAFLSSLMLTFIPAVGPAQSSVFTRGILKKTEDFLISIGAISGFDIVFSIMLLYTVGKARIGVLEVAGQFFNFDFSLLVISLLIVLGVGCLSYFLTLNFGKIIVKYLDKINYHLLVFVVIIGVCAASFFFDGFLGLFFLFAAAGVGTLADKLKTKMTHCMGVLMIPVLIYYFV